ncbi:MAG: hypothetical protein ACTSP3_12650, partial [Candidatus Heimdallarchaeaceae archaeon]
MFSENEYRTLISLRGKQVNLNISPSEKVRKFMLDSSSKITNQLHGGDKKVKLGILVSATGIGVFLSSLDQ